MRLSNRDIEQVTDAGQTTSLAIRADGSTIVAYKAFFSNLRYQVLNDSGQEVESGRVPAGAGLYSSLSLTPDGLPAIAFSDVDNDTLQFAVRVFFSEP